MSAEYLPNLPSSGSWLHPPATDFHNPGSIRVPEPRRAGGIEPSIAENPYADPLLSIVVDLLPIAVVVINQAHLPLFTNPAADSVIRKGEVFYLGATGALKLTDPSQRPLFEAFVASFCGVARKGDDHPPTTRFFVKRQSDPPVSITGSVCNRVDGSSTIVLFIRVPDGATQLPSVSLMALFNLTPAEANLANSLVAGESLAEYCRRRNISLNTGKTQLKAVLGKTGTRRQVQLVRMLAL